MITPDDLIDFAAFDLSTAESEVAARRAISAAYYALFHAFVHAAAALFDGPSDLRNRLARSIDHGQVKAMADEVEARARAKRDIDPRLALVARSLKRLREARETADYNLSATVSWAEAGSWILEAVGALNALKQIKAEPATAEYLLFPLLRDRHRRG